MNKKKIILIVVINICSIIVLLYCGWIVSFYVCNKLDIVSIDDEDRDYGFNYFYSQLQNYHIANTITKEEIKDSLYQKFDVKYKYSEKDLYGNVKGYSHLLDHSIEIDENIDDIMIYTITLTHEIMHLKKHCANEMRTQWYTFRYLYYSDSSFYHICGCRFALQCFSGEYPDEYDCSYYILPAIQD